jgi:hypothetical protein
MSDDRRMHAWWRLAAWLDVPDVRSAMVGFCYGRGNALYRRINPEEFGGRRR